MDTEDDLIYINSADGTALETYVARPGSSSSVDIPAVLILHGFPSSLVGAANVGSDLSQLADRAASEMGWLASSIRFRGCGTSGGDFSLQGWVDDACAALRFLQQEGQPDRMWVCGFGTGGVVALEAAAHNPAVSGVATIGSPADFTDWAQRPEQLLQYARSLGAVKTPSFPADVNRWAEELANVSGLRAAEKISNQALMVLHGSSDEIVPVFDARVLADSHGSAELHLVTGGGHQLRNDPRAIAILLGWLDRQRIAAARTV